MVYMTTLSLRRLHCHYCLQCLVMGALMRPMDMRRDQSTESFVGDNGNSHDIEIKPSPGDDQPTADCTLLTPGWLQTSSYHDVRKLDTIGRSFAAITEHDGLVTNTPTSHNVTDHVMNTVHTTANDHMRHESHVTSRHSKSAGNLAKPTNRCHHVRQVGASVGHRSRSCGELTAVSTRRPSAARKCDGFHASADPLHRKDLIYGGSLAALAVVEFPPARRAPSAGAREPSRRAWRGACSSLGNLLDLSVLRNVYFVIISFASVFIQLGYYIPFVFLADYAASLGVDPSSTASLLVIIGASSRLRTVSILLYFIIFYILLYLIISYYILLYLIISYYILSYFILLYLILFHFIIYYILLYFIISYYILLYLIISYYILLYLIISYYILFHFISFYYILLYFINFFYILLYFIIFYYILLYFIIFYYILLYFSIF